MTGSGLPGGFIEIEGAVPEVRLIAARSRIDELREAGLGSPRRWREILGGGGAATGRGATGRLELADGARIFLKQMRRGGMVGPLWQERFPGRRRLLANVEIPLFASSKGVATPAPVALLLQEGPSGLFRAWMAFEEIADARDLASRFASGPVPDDREMAQVMDLVRRMHDAGIDHRDLNLGNLLLSTGDRGTRAWVVDLDRGVIHGGPLPFRWRQRALRRLERSYAKLVGELGTARRRWYDLYAGDDRELLARLLRGEAAGAMWLRLRGR